ncbi:MAG: XRE family transcriptional regulator [Dehalococcoidia bacterium]|nr:MAG: XRE family transcriptional regulator [Dehalococcoidia bacterium]
MNTVTEGRELGKILKRQRIAADMTLAQLSSRAGVSPSHLGRVERGQRFPSAHILHRIAGPLGFAEDELFALAGYLSRRSGSVADRDHNYAGSRLDPYVANVLGQETPEVQRTVVGVLTILKNIARSLRD